MEISRKIAEKAHILFIKYGIRGVSMDDIATDLGISKKTIYQFYPNKDSLVNTLVDKAIDQHIFHCKTLVSKSDDAVIELYFLLIYAREFYNVLNATIIHDLERNHESAYDKLMNHKKLFLYSAIKASIQRGIKAGLYRDDFDVDLIIRFFLESLALILDTAAFPLTRQTAPKQADELFTCLIHGIVTATGMQVINSYKNQEEPDAFNT